ncbi:hypothetical protein [Paenibacillus alvei]|uniref:hypothetical protein n=1 Tax=Paenibacillus alvei TaxID=44250 RepID=UPI0013DC8628|nr:hypothetical protein [Paenibacillus alvei]MCY9543467.1 hypothetical protein [Paenibacillus alvei]MEC0082256.1 hypothetical protein [Paenibacillus alvei]NEZ45508.1 hypothetical protein [Paenibacillus alvei]
MKTFKVYSRDEALNQHIEHLCSALDLGYSELICSLLQSIFTESMDYIYVVKEISKLND